MTELNVMIEESQVNYEYKTLSTPWPAALVQTRNAWTTGNPSTRSWDVSWSLLSEAELDQIIALHEETGCAGKFQWIPTGEVTAIDVRFVDGSFKYQAGTGQTFQARCVIEALRPTE